MSKRTGFIYCIKNKINGKRYTGQTVDIKMRWRSHRSRLNKNKHGNYILQNEWNEYGENNFKFKIIQDEINADDLNKKEKFYINKFDSFESGYNLNTGGGNNFNVSDDVRKRIRKNHAKYWQGTKSEENPFYGQKHSKESKIKMSKRKKSLDGNKNAQKVTKEIASKIFKEFWEEEITQKELSDKYNFCYSTVSRIVNCKHFTTKHKNKPDKSNEDRINKLSKIKRKKI